MALDGTPIVQSADSMPQKRIVPAYKLLGFDVISKNNIERLLSRLGTWKYSWLKSFDDRRNEWLLLADEQDALIFVKAMQSHWILDLDTNILPLCPPSLYDRFFSLPKNSIGWFYSQGVPINPIIDKDISKWYSRCKGACDIELSKRRDVSEYIRCSVSKRPIIDKHYAVHDGAAYDFFFLIGHVNSPGETLRFQVVDGRVINCGSICQYPEETLKGPREG